MERLQYEFSGYRLDAVSRELFGPDGAMISVTSKALDVLAYLIRQRDRVVDKDDLLAAVWAGRVVEENNLTQAISALRKAFGVRPPEHRFIITVSGRGYRFVADVSEFDKVEAATPAPPQTALAVLPFRSISSGPRDELLELGLAETLITQLSRARQLRVRALASSQHFRQDLLHDPGAAGRQLGADYVVDGSAQRINGHLRVNVRLLSVAQGATIWADTLDASADSVFMLQDRISDAVVKALAVPPIVVPERACSACDGSNPKAYRAWLRGHHLLQRPDEANLKEALSAFRGAIDLDPACTRAYAGMALAYRGLVHIDHEPDEMFTLAKAAVAQALAIDPDSGEALMAQGRNRQLYDWDWVGAEASLQRAIAVNPSLSEAYLAYAHLLTVQGRFDESLETVRQARELDPLSPLVNALYAGFLTAAGQSAAADKQLQRALELRPGFWIALQIRGGITLDRGDVEAAVADLNMAVETSHRASQILAVQAIVCAAAGDRARTQAILDELRARRAEHYVPATSFAAVHLALGDVDAALDELERAYRERDIRMVFLKVDARWNPLRPQPRFRALAQRMGLAGDHGDSRL
ncbi:MAG TPA: winged helix-turn-helix domain-containing protein [Rhodanobacteraceae bacterium]|nr:winged helix-turn-helix domain-containing protein [Rhodanobacteraceae bacterium]